MITVKNILLNILPTLIVATIMMLMPSSAAAQQRADSIAAISTANTGNCLLYTVVS